MMFGFFTNVRKDSEGFIRLILKSYKKNFRLGMVKKSAWKV